MSWRKKSNLGFYSFIYIQVKGCWVVSMEILGETYTSEKLLILSNLCENLILGHVILKQR